MSESLGRGSWHECSLCVCMPQRCAAANRSAEGVGFSRVALERCNLEPVTQHWTLISAHRCPWRAVGWPKLCRLWKHLPANYLFLEEACISSAHLQRTWVTWRWKGWWGPWAKSPTAQFTSWSLRSSPAIWRKWPLCLGPWPSPDPSEESLRVALRSKERRYLSAGKWGCPITAGATHTVLLSPSWRVWQERLKQSEEFIKQNWVWNLGLPPY